MQSTDGFIKAGGFKNVYRGVLATSLGAFPGSAAFFSCYVTAKQTLQKVNGGKEHPIHHSVAASMGEVGACIVRVPTAVVTQRMQVGQYGKFSEAVTKIWAEGGLRSFYVGYGTTVAREIPFSFIQFPIYEKLKKIWAEKQGEECGPIQGATCGSAAGSVAAGLTTPLDVVKTRMMLGVKDGVAPYVGTLPSLQRIAREEGMAALFGGIGPRIGWITCGGFIFFGAYEYATQTLWKSGIFGSQYTEEE